MKNLSVKTRITLWFGILMLAITVLVLIFMLSIGSSVINSDVKSTLTDVVEESLDDIDYEHDELDIDDDLSFFTKGVYLQIYDSSFTFLDGYFPENYPQTEMNFTDKTVQTLNIAENSYYIYDYEITFKKNNSLWVRGIISLSDSDESYASLIKIAFIALPILIILGTAGGYIIIRKSFRPIDRIIITAEKIGEGRDLSERIALGNGNDEVYKLATAFDRMLSRLQQSFEICQQFTSDVSHELRTPTAVILAQCEYALNDASTDTEYKEALEVVNRQADRMSQIISRLLQLARMDKNTLITEFETFNLSELITVFCDEYCFSDNNLKNISLHSFVEPNIYILADRSLILQLISNLLNNAYQYGKTDGFINVSLSADETVIQLIVEDNGIGISDETKSKIWDRFYRANEARSYSDNNFGLGLSIVKEIVKIHDGEISVKSQLGVGSSFIFQMKKTFLL